MAKLSAHGSEIYRYFSPKYHALLSIRTDGHTLMRLPGGGWSCFTHKKSSVSMEEWREIKKQRYAELPAWARECKTLPSPEELNRWSMDGVCEATDGTVVEPDYRGPGSPAWLVALGWV